MDQIKIGKYIARKRKEKGLTQTRVAEVLLVTDRAVSRWENGKNLPDMELIPQLCNLYGISLNEFFSGEDIKGKSVWYNTLFNNDNSPLICLIIMVFLMFFTTPIAKEKQCINRFARFDNNTTKRQVETTIGKSEIVSDMLPYVKYSCGSNEILLYFDGNEDSSQLFSIILRRNGVISDTIIIPFLDGTYTFTEGSDVAITFEKGTYHFNGDFTFLGLDKIYSGGKCSFIIEETKPENGGYLYKMHLKDKYPLLIGCKTNDSVIIYNDGHEYLFEKQ